MNRLTNQAIIKLCHDVQIGTGGMDYADALTAIGEEMEARKEEEARSLYLTSEQAELLPLTDQLIRLSKINRDLCHSHNTLLIENVNLERALKARETPCPTLP